MRGLQLLALRGLTLLVQQRAQVADEHGVFAKKRAQHMPAYASICQHMPAYASIRQHTPAYVRIRQRTPAYVCIRLHTSAYASIRPHTPAYVRIPACRSSGRGRLVCEEKRSALWHQPRLHRTARSWNVSGEASRICRRIH